MLDYIILAYISDVKKPIHDLALSLSGLLLFLKPKMLNIWFQLLKLEDMRLFFVIYDSKLSI